MYIHIHVHACTCTHIHIHIHIHIRTHTYTHTCKYIFIFLAVNVKVTHVETPEEFFIQYVKELPKLNNINKQIGRHCKKVKQEAILQPGEVKGH